MNLKKVFVVAVLAACGSSAHAQLPGSGLGAIPLIGADLANMSSPDGLLAAAQNFADDQTLPIGFPVIGRRPHRTYGPVILTLLYTRDPSGQLKNTVLSLPSMPALPSAPALPELPTSDLPSLR